MKIRPAMGPLLFLILCSLAVIARTPQAAPGSQTAAPPAASTHAGPASQAPPQIDPAKEAAIRHLLEVAGTADAARQIMDGMQTTMRPLMTNSLPPGEYREKLLDLFFERFRSKADIQHLLDLTVQLYDKYLSLDDINGLIQFYSTPLGKKTLSVLPKLTLEMQNESVKWGETLGRDSMLEVLSEHPDLAQALMEARKNAQAP